VSSLSTGRPTARDWLSRAGQPTHLPRRCKHGNVSTVVAQQDDTPINERLGRDDLGESVQLVGPMWSHSGRFIAVLASLEGAEYTYVPVVFALEVSPSPSASPGGEFPEPFAWSSEDLLAYTQGEAPNRITRPMFSIRQGMSIGASSPRMAKSTRSSWTLVWSPSRQRIGLSLWTLREIMKQSLCELPTTDSGDVQEM
jgi:hypothetical protein